jgi:hypothetical protein
LSEQLAFGSVRRYLSVDELLEDLAIERVEEDLGDLPVARVIHVHVTPFVASEVPRRAEPVKTYGMVVSGKNVVDVDLQCSRARFDQYRNDHPEESFLPVVAGKPAASGDVDDEVIGEEVSERIQIRARQGRHRPSYRLLVRMQSRSLLLRGGADRHGRAAPTRDALAAARLGFTIRLDL